MAEPIFLQNYIQIIYLYSMAYLMTRHNDTSDVTIKKCKLWGSQDFVGGTRQCKWCIDTAADSAGHACSWLSHLWDFILSSIVVTLIHIMVNRSISRDLKMAAIRLHDLGILCESELLYCVNFSRRTFYRIKKLWSQMGMLSRTDAQQHIGLGLLSAMIPAICLAWWSSCHKLTLF